MAERRAAPALTRRGMIGAAAGLATPAFAGGEVALARSATRAGLLFGAAVEPEDVERNPAYRRLVARQCAVLTPENVMKWDALRPGPGVFDFDRADRLMAIARSQGAKVHGHCLLWHEANPPWLVAAARGPAARELLVEHISTVVGRYAGQIHSWDVVNEAVERNDGRKDGLRRSIWLEALGPEYLDLAFRTAHAADPAARLDLSDYGLEYDDVSWMGDKRATMLALLETLRGRGVPLHALALQGHLEGTRDPAFGAGLSAFLRAVADLGLEIYVTELDVNDQEVKGPVAERDARGAEQVRAFLSGVCATAGVRMICTWGLSDRYSSKSSLFPRADGSAPRPLPFDAVLRPKALAFAMTEVFEAAGRRF
jgi:endo-1,4-beta-xylanase